MGNSTQDKQIEALTAKLQAGRGTDPNAAHLVDRFGPILYCFCISSIMYQRYRSGVIFEKGRLMDSKRAPFRIS